MHSLIDGNAMAGSALHCLCGNEEGDLHFDWDSFWYGVR